MSQKRDKLSKKILEFVQAQPGYDNLTREKIRTGLNEGTFTAIYGKDEMAGIFGFGSDIDLTFADCKELETIEWI